MVVIHTWKHLGFYPTLNYIVSDTCHENTISRTRITESTTELTGLCRIGLLFVEKDSHHSPLKLWWAAPPHSWTTKVCAQNSS